MGPLDTSLPRCLDPHGAPSDRARRPRIGGWKGVAAMRVAHQVQGNVRRGARKILVIEPRVGGADSARSGDDILLLTLGAAIRMGLAGACVRPFPDACRRVPSDARPVPRACDSGGATGPSSRPHRAASVAPTRRAVRFSPGLSERASTCDPCPSPLVYPGRRGGVLGRFPPAELARVPVLLSPAVRPAAGHLGAIGHGGSCGRRGADVFPGRPPQHSRGRGWRPESRAARHPPEQGSALQPGGEQGMSGRAIRRSRDRCAAWSSARDHPGVIPKPLSNGATA